MPPKMIQHTDIASTFDACYLGTSAIKYSDDDTTRQYPFVWASLTNRTSGVFYSGLYVVFNTECRLPICHMHDNNSALCVMNENNNNVTDALKMLQTSIEKTLPGKTITPLVRCSDNPRYANSKTICLKTRFTIFNNKTYLQTNSTLTRYVLTLQKLNIQEKQYIPQLSLTAVGACETSTNEDRGSNSPLTSCSEQAKPITHDDIFAMMMQ